MMMKKRTFSKEEKLQIIKEASQQGVYATLVIGNGQYSKNRN
jgi:transposase-like protein